MQAHELATPYPTVTMDTNALEAARLLTEHGRPGLIVVDEQRAPDRDPAGLPGAADAHARATSRTTRRWRACWTRNTPTGCARRSPTRPCATCCRRTGCKLPVVAPDDTVLEIAAIMAANRSPLVAVVEERSKTAPLLGRDQRPQLLGRILPVS